MKMKFVPFKMQLKKYYQYNTKIHFVELKNHTPATASTEMMISSFAVEFPQTLQYHGEKWEWGFVEELKPRA